LLLMILFLLFLYNLAFALKYYVLLYIAKPKVMIIMSMFMNKMCKCILF
jgi:hypothetical protein